MGRRRSVRGSRRFSQRGNERVSVSSGGKQEQTAYRVGYPQHVVHGRPTLVSEPIEATVLHQCFRCKCPNGANSCTSPAEGRHRTIFREAITQLHKRAGQRLACAINQSQRTSGFMANAPVFCPFETSSLQEQKQPTPSCVWRAS